MLDLIKPYAITDVCLGTPKQLHVRAGAAALRRWCARGGQHHCLGFHQVTGRDGRRVADDHAYNRGRLGRCRISARRGIFHTR